MDYVLIQVLEMVSTICFPRNHVLCSALVLFIRKLGRTDCPAGVLHVGCLHCHPTKVETQSAVCATHQTPWCRHNEGSHL